MELARIIFEHPTAINDDVERSRCKKRLSRYEMDWASCNPMEMASLKIMRGHDTERFVLMEYVSDRDRWKLVTQQEAEDEIRDTATTAVS